MTLPAGSVINGIEDGNRIPSVPNWQTLRGGHVHVPGPVSSPGRVTSPPPGNSSADQITQSGITSHPANPSTPYFGHPGAGSFAHNLPYATG